MNKPMLGVDDLILHMKSKGIAFTEMSEDDAKAYLMCTEQRKKP